MKHNAWSYRNGTCVCEVCTAAHRERVASETRARSARRVLVDGRLMAPVPDDHHGRASTYGNHACRCVPCTTAARESKRSRRERPAAA